MDDNQLVGFLSNKANIANYFPSNIVLESLLAMGGQGIVYKGSFSGVDAAIKIYLPGQIQLRVDREIEALTKLKSPNIVSLMWSGEIQIDDYQLPSMVTTYIHGAPLSEVLKTQSLNPTEIGIIAYDISNAIQAMWEHHIVHRDLKPPNIMIKSDKRACVIDLGIARHLNRTPLTATGATWGTQGYMSPEQSRFQKTLTCKSDIFALGVIIVESFLRKHPTSKDQMRLLSRKLHEVLPSEIEYWEYANLLKSMLNPEPPKRPKPDILLERFKEFSFN